MKIILNEDEAIVKVVRDGLKMNGNYCPCVRDSYGKPEYKCMCEPFKAQDDGWCHCMLYKKVKD